MAAWQSPSPHSRQADNENVSQKCKIVFVLTFVVHNLLELVVGPSFAWWLHIYLCPLILLEWDLWLLHRLVWGLTLSACMTGHFTSTRWPIMNFIKRHSILRITRICFLSLKHLLKDVGVRVRQDVSIMFLLGRLKWSSNFFYIENVFCYKGQAKCCSTFSVPNWVTCHVNILSPCYG